VTLGRPLRYLFKTRPPPNKIKIGDFRELTRCRIAAMNRRIHGRLVLATLVMVTALVACGGSSGGSALAPTPSATAAALPTPTTTPAPRSCPTAVKVGSALGITLPKPTGVPYTGGGTPLPAGATGITCEYPAKSYNVILEVIMNISPSYIELFSSHFPVAYTNVPGVGDQARAFTVSLGGGKDNEGVVATKGSTLVAIVATATPASLAQLEALVNQLL
jgi:hypothetical protein